MPPATNLGVDTYEMMCRNNDTKYIHVTLPYSSFAILQNHCNYRLNRDVHHTHVICLLLMCACATAQRKEEEEDQEEEEEEEERMMKRIILS